jgi:cysteine desulfurase
MTGSNIYLDHNASAPLLPEARAAMLAAFDLTGNPSSVHAHGRALRAVVETGRGQVAALTGAERKQVVFTGSASEAITQAIVGGARAFPVKRIVVSAGEHTAALKAAEATGLPVTTLGLDADGIVDLEALAALVAGDELLLVAIHTVNNETGVVQPLSRIEALVGPTPHLLFIDAAQACGKLPLEFSARAADMMAVSAHKIGGPVGIGALLVKSHADEVRLIPGGGQEQGRRGGTEAAALIAGFGAAAEAFPKAYVPETTAGLVSQLEAGIRHLAPDALIFGESVERAGNVVDFAVPGLGNAVAMMGLDLAGVSVSSGSACSSGKVGPSHVLAAMGYAPEICSGALRVSLGWTSNEHDVEGFLSAFETVLTRHRRRQGQAA